MIFSRPKWGTLLFAFFIASALSVASQDPPAPPSKAPAQSNFPTKLTIEVTGGERSVPVENASVYVKY
ncbi:MAG: hypothetical protein WB543_17435, partial [Candidatus Acidiferrum sp.]